MSNIYVGGISFDSGFSSGFQQTPLNISNVEIASTSATVSITSGFVLNVSATAIDILPLAPLEVTTTQNTSAITVSSVIDILSLDVQEVIISSNIDVSPSVIDIYVHDVTVNVNSNVLVSVATSIINVVTPLHTVTTTSNINTNTSASLIDILSLDVIVNIGNNALIDVNQSTIDIFSTSATILTSSSQLVSTSASLIDILSLDVIASVGDNALIDVNQSTINIFSTSAAILTGSSQLVSTSASSLEILSINPLVNITTGITQVVDPSIINITSYTPDVTITNGVYIPTISSVIKILPNDASVGKGILIDVDTSLIEVIILQTTNTIGISEYISATSSIIDIYTLDVEVEAGTDILTSATVIEITPNEVVTKEGVGVIGSDSPITIGIPDVIVSIGVQIPTSSTTIDILSNTVVTSIGAYGYPETSVITMTPFGPLEVQYGVGIITSPSIINIILRVIDGAGPKIPNWSDCDASIDNPYWDTSSDCRTKESELFNGLVDNAFNLYGVDAVWYPVDYSLENEKVYGEDNSRTVLRNFRMKYYVDDLNQVATDSRQYNRWGIEGLDNFEVYISKQQYEQASQLNMNGNIVSRPYLPKPGDIMRSDHKTVYYEVVEVKDRTELFLQRSHTWSMTLRPITNKKYDFDTGLIGDPIISALQVNDVLSQNDYIDTKTSAVLYNDPINPSDDPFNLFG
jgi:rRNA-processing protein FCF1